jgi:hypothetical protein
VPHRSRRPFVNSSIAAGIALLASSLAAAALAHGGDHRSQAQALSPPACGASGGALADPADTQRCLAERYKPPSPKPAASSAPTNAAPPSNAGA